MGYYIRHVLVTYISIDGVPTPRKRLCIHGNRHGPRAQYALDEEDVVACVAVRESASTASWLPLDGLRLPHWSMASRMALVSRHAASTASWLPRRLLRRLDGLDDAVDATGRWQLTGIIGRVEASEDHVSF